MQSLLVLGEILLGVAVATLLYVMVRVILIQDFTIDNLDEGEIDPDLL